MTVRTENYVRFQDWRSEYSSEPETPRSRGNVILITISKIFKRVYELFGNSLLLGSQIRNSSERFKSQKYIIDPQGAFLQEWNKIFIILCAIAVAVDPLFLYIPMVDGDNICLDMDKNLEITASILRSFTDIFYILHIIFQFRTGFLIPSSSEYGRDVLVTDKKAIAKKYLSTYFLLDLLAVIPLPQIVILVVFPRLQGRAIANAKNMLIFIVVFQYFPRVARILPLYLQITRSSGIITETAWAGAAFNLVLYMIVSHVYGALWYLLSIQREEGCWSNACNVAENCETISLYCGQKTIQNNTILLTPCSTNMANASLLYGIYLPAVQNAVQSKGFFEKFFYCFWWGLQNLSTLGQNLRPSFSTWENLFSISVAVFGLILFAILIGKMQTYLQSASTRTEETRENWQDAEKWMGYRLLPDSMKERIRRYQHYRWQATRGVDEEHIVSTLPKDLRRDIKRHLTLSLLRRVPMFEKMDNQLLDAMCDRLKPVLYTKSSCIIRENDPVNEMLFIMRGSLESVISNGRGTGFFNSNILKEGDFCGEEILTWALDPHSSSLPISQRTVTSVSEVEAFTLKADDLKFVATQYRKLHSKHLQNTFRFYSQHWRNWAACYIQDAWRRHCTRKLEESLYARERMMQAAIVNDRSSTPSLGAALYAARFASNMLRILKRKSRRRLLERLPSKLLLKPSEPKFGE